MKRFILFWALLVLIVPSVAMATGKNKRQLIMAATEVAVSAPVSVTITNGNYATGYLIIKTENETASASLETTVLMVSPLGDELLCTLTAITIEATTSFLLGTFVGPSSDVLATCDFPMPRQIKFTFTVTGAGADFDVSAEMQWIGDPAI
jgi:hypothetical protein